MQVAMLLSGGVDSSVAMVELLRAGHKVHAYYIKVWLEDGDVLGDCPWKEDLAIAQSVCAQYSVPLRVLSLQEEYRNIIIEHTLKELRMGATPSPDVLCNRHIKFKLALSQIPYQYVASGHYATLRRGVRGTHLYQARDPVKDQTYFLFNLTPQQLQKLIFPIGRLTKAQVRSRALRYGLPNAGRPDSQGLCFLGAIRFADFIRHYLGERAGPIIESESGKVIGEHKGHWFYTVGQRRALGLSGGPWYVVAKDAARNCVVVSRNAIAHRQRSFELEWLHINNQNITAPPRRVTVKIRHGAAMQPATLTMLADGRYRVTLRRAELGIATGQYAVIYWGRQCIGGGRILSDSWVGSSNPVEPRHTAKVAQP